MSSEHTLEHGRFFWIAIFICAALLFLYGWGSIVIFQHGAWTEDTGWSATPKNGSWLVTTVDPAGPAAGQLRPGDRIRAVNGDAGAISLDPDWILQLIRPNQPYTVSVQSFGVRQTRYLSPTLKHDVENIYWMASLVLVGLTFFVVGAMIGLLKPSDPLARIGFVFTIAAALHMLGTALRPLRGTLGEGSTWLYAATYSAMFLPDAFEYHFVSRFPVWIRESRFWRLLRMFLYTFAALLFGRHAYLTLSLAAGVRPYGLSYSRLVPVLEDTYFLVIIGSAVAVMIRNYSRVTEPDLLRRIKWVTYGIAVAILPVTTYMVASFVASISGNSWVMQKGFWYNFNRFENIALILLPITFAYCVIKNRVMGIDFVLRRGLQYLLAKNSLRFLLFLPWLSLASIVLLHPEMRLRDIFASNSIPFYAGTSLAAGVSIRYRHQLMNVLDRKFFRVSYDREQILLDLIEEMNSAESVRELSDLVRAKVEAAFQPQSARVLYREPHAPNDPLTVALGPQRTAFDLRLNPARLSPAGQRWLKELGVHLVAPILGSDDRVIGAVCLGEKKSEEPYTKADRSTLQMIAAQFAAVAENLWLRKRVSAEQNIRHDVLARLGTVPSFVKECQLCGSCYDHHATVCQNDGSELTLTLPVDRILENKYRLDRRIGAGSTGAVYQGWDLRLARTVAIKVMTGRLFGNRVTQRRFEREAQMLARLDHENIVAIHDFGLIEGGGAFIVMQYLPGTNLRKELSRRRIIPANVAASWIDQLLAGVAAAHAQGVIHRDLKPENVLVARAAGVPETIKILDFGLAKLWEGSDMQTITRAGTVVGTFGYMAPEQMLGEEVDVRADIFALGVIVLESLNGRHPFALANPGDLLASIEQARLSSPSPQLTAILRRCVSPDPERRYDSVVELRQELVPVIRAYGTLIAGELNAPTQTDTLIATQV